jgi:hypothetical protein
MEKEKDRRLNQRRRAMRRRAVRRALGAAWRRPVAIDAEWRKAHSTAPLPLLRWLGALGVVIWFWDKTGASHSASAFLTAWLPALVLVLVLVLPDAASVTFGGLKVEMRRTREEVAGLNQKIMLMSMQAQRQGQVAQFIFGGLPGTLAALGYTGAAADTTEREVDEDEPVASTDRFLGSGEGAVDSASADDVTSGS